jgi:thiamine biosynthesis lipoprotein
MPSAMLSSTVAFVAMDTCISVQVVSSESEEVLQDVFDRIQEWFFQVEQVCNRFDEQSEVYYLANTPGVPVKVSPLLFLVLQFSLEIARLSEGAFDPALGYQLVKAGFDQHYLTREKTPYRPAPGELPTYRDILLDTRRQTVTLNRPLLLDLGGVAKGLAIDLAVQELAAFSDYAINAGGDLYIRGYNERQEPWRIGIRHPRQSQHCLARLHGSWKDGMAICTSGDYERRSPSTTAHHLFDPRTGHPAGETASVTVMAPGAMLADALSTAAFVLGPGEGVRLLQHCGLDGVIFSSTLEAFMTPGMRRYLS